MRQLPANTIDPASSGVPDVAGQHGGDIDPLAMQAQASTSGNEDVPVMERIPTQKQSAPTIERERGRERINLTVEIGSSNPAPIAATLHYDTL